ncbi:hypothetical protein CsSME_00051628 [Camellia sinensis var. sinensis]
MEKLHLIALRVGKAHWLSSSIQLAATDPTRAQWDIDNCTILGWMFNSMEDHIYHIFLYCDTVSSLCCALSEMYAHAHNDARIFELYQDIARASQSALGLSVSENWLNMSP